MKNVNKLFIGCIIIAIVIIGLLIWKSKEDYSAGEKVFQAESVENISIQEELAQPVIRVNPPSYDFGTVIYGEVSRQEFELSNTSEISVEILKISTSCGCTKAFLADELKVIQPGESAKLVVTFDPAVHKDDTDVGELTRVVYIRTTDEVNPETEIHLKANVIKK